MKLRTSSNFRNIAYDTWRFFHATYGGGPEVFFIPFGNQPTPAQVQEMVHEIEEHERQQQLKQSHPIIREASDGESEGGSPMKMLKISESIEAEV